MRATATTHPWATQGSPLLWTRTNLFMVIIAQNGKGRPQAKGRPQGIAPTMDGLHEIVQEVGITLRRALLVQYGSIGQGV